MSKAKISISIDVNLIKWIDDQVEHVRANEKKEAKRFWASSPHLPLRA